MADPLEALGAPAAEPQAQEDDPLTALGAPPKQEGGFSPTDALTQAIAKAVSSVVGQGAGLLAAGGAELGRGLLGVGAKAADWMDKPEIRDKLLELGLAMDPQKIAQETAEKLDLSPTTELGKKVTDLGALPLKLYNEGTAKLGEETLAATGSPLAATVADVGTNLLGQAALGRLVGGKLPPEGAGKAPPLAPGEQSPVQDLLRTKASELRVELADPIGAGGPEAAAIASDYASKNRAAQYQRNDTVKELNDKFTPEEHQEMYDALSEENVKQRQMKAQQQAQAAAPKVPPQQIQTPVGPVTFDQSHDVSLLGGSNGKGVVYADKDWNPVAQLAKAQGPVVYHGTNADFKDFHEDFIGEGHGAADWGRGFYFTDTPKAADTYATGNGGNIRPVRLELKNPATRDTMQLPEVQNAIDDDMGFEDVRDVLAARGHDGVVIEHPGGEKEYAVFNSKQIKSAFGSAPEKVPIDRRPFLAVHEKVEADLEAKGESYAEAHKQATAAERAAVEQAGVDWKDYQDSYAPEIKAAARKQNPVPPPDIVEKPYEHPHSQRAKEELDAVEEASGQTGFGKLPQKLRDKAQSLSADHEATAAKAVSLGILGDKFDVYDPRVLVRLLDDGMLQKLGGKGRDIGGGSGANLQKSVRTAGLERKNLTAEGTEAAGKRLFENLGQDPDSIKLLRDIRLLPMATAALKKAIAGRELLGAIKKEGDRTGVKLLSNRPEGPDWFTVEGSPMFTVRKPLIRAGEPVRDANGRLVFKDSQIYLDPKFEGPIKAIMDSNEPGKVYKGLMAVKRLAVGAIMFNPLTHNITILSKVLPFGLARTPGWYFQGYKLRQSQAFLKEALENGVQFVDQGRANNEFGDGGLPKASLDRLGKLGKLNDFYHGTLLWNRIADMQAGLYSWVKQDRVKQGWPEKAAGAAAARMANLYGGAIPKEELADLANKVANFALFSKSFTGTNLALYKDAVAGFPASTRGKIMQAFQEAGKTMKEGDAAQGPYAKRQAFSALVKDIAFAYGGLTAANYFIQKYKNKDNPDKLAQDYANRLDWVVNQTKADPMYPLENPLDTVQYLLSPVEAGKEGRTYIGDDATTGRPLYGRPTFGKVADDIVQAWKAPGDLLDRKLSPSAKFLKEVANNKDFYGAKLWLADEGVGKNMLDVGKEFVKMNLPSDVLSTVNELLSDNRITDAQKLRLVGSLSGAFSVSQGVGQEKAVILQEQQQRADKLKRSMEQINKLMDTDPDKASEMMEDLGMRPGEIMQKLRHREHMAEPSLTSRINAARNMTDNTQDVMERPTNE